MRSPLRLLIAIAALAVLVAACTPTSEPGEDTTTISTTKPTTTTSPEGTVDAPDFPAGLDWINTDEPISLNDLKGKVVLLDFWTYGCINCIHVIPDLERLEAEYPNELVIIGVHSAKFTNESETGNLIDIVQRYGLRHPVVNDKNFEIWDQWGATAWPSVALIDPAGKAVGIRPGEGVYDAIEPVVALIIERFDAAGAMDRTPIEFALEATTAPARSLSYPGKVLARGGRLWISDTGHHRILEVDPATGDVLAAYGSGKPGFIDGTTIEAAFHDPQGMTLDADRNLLYVADVANHAVRAIDLETGEVSTLAGTGALGWPPSGGPLDSITLNSPWDVEYSDDFVYVANAGTHQIWTLDLIRETGSPLIGNAREGTANGNFSEAELAQPSGLAITPRGELFFADSESSSIRVGLLLTATTSLVVGGDASLFEFGDVDGFGNAARLQHPLGVSYHENTLYVADTYNSKIKRIDVENGGITSWLGDDPGWADGAEPLFNEPGGLSFDDGTLFVADTNNHAIRMIDPTTGETTTLILKGVERFDPPTEFIGQIVTLDPLDASAGPATLVLNYELPAGYKVNEDAPSSITINGGRTVAALASAGDLTGTKLPADVPLTLTEGTATVSFDINLVYCAETAESLCLIDRVRFEIPLTVGPAGPSTILNFTRTVTATG